MELLQGASCYLKSFDETHLNHSDYLNWVRDYDVIKTLNKIDYLRPVSFEEVKQYCNRLMLSQEDMFFALHEKTSNKFIGTLRVSQISWRNLTADVGLMIGDKTYWNKGIASQAIKIICRYLFTHLGFRKLTAGYMAINPAMGKAFIKSGFKQEAILREQNYFEGQYIDHILIGCFSHEFIF